MERDDAPLADEPQPGAVPNDMPSGMPAGEDDPEPEPLGAEDPSDEPEQGEDAMPGIPTEGDDPYSAG
ncbi:MAG TPA: hypothetical protein VF549_10390 [Solirubrobacteraceae bacterium]|jgi:hypothetical protein